MLRYIVFILYMSKVEIKVPLQWQSCQHLWITRKNTIFEVLNGITHGYIKNYGFLMLKNVRFYYIN